MPTDYTESVAAEARAQAARLGLSVRDLAIKMGWSYSYLWRRMHGGHPWSTSDIEQLAQALEIPLSDLTSPRHQAAS